jgi:hypothetical protein
MEAQYEASQPRSSDVLPPLKPIALHPGEHLDRPGVVIQPLEVVKPTKPPPPKIDSKIPLEVRSDEEDDFSDGDGGIDLGGGLK